MTGDLIAMLGQFGFPGAMIAYMVWDRREQNKLIKERTEADLEMARALTLLTARIDHVRSM